MGLREKVALFLVSVLFLQIEKTSCMPRSVKNSAVQRILNNNDVISTLPKRVIPQPDLLDPENFRNDVNNPERSVYTVLNFPEIEYPLHFINQDGLYYSNFGPSVDTKEFSKYASSNGSRTVNSNFINKFKKEAKIKNIYRNSDSTYTISNNDSLKAAHESNYFNNIGVFPKVEYPLVAQDMWIPYYWRPLTVILDSPAVSNNNFDHMKPQIIQKIKTDFLKLLSKGKRINNINKPTEEGERINKISHPMSTGLLLTEKQSGNKKKSKTSNDVVTNVTNMNCSQACKNTNPLSNDFPRKIAVNLIPSLLSTMASNSTSTDYKYIHKDVQTRYKPTLDSSSKFFKQHNRTFKNRNSSTALNNLKNYRNLNKTTTELPTPVSHQQKQNVCCDSNLTSLIDHFSESNLYNNTNTKSVNKSTLKTLLSPSENVPLPLPDIILKKFLTDTTINFPHNGYLNNTLKLLTDYIRKKTLYDKGALPYIDRSLHNNNDNGLLNNSFEQVMNKTNITESSKTNDNMTNDLPEKSKESIKIPIFTKFILSFNNYDENKPVSSVNDFNISNTLNSSTITNPVTKQTKATNVTFNCIKSSNSSLREDAFETNTQTAIYEKLNMTVKGRANKSLSEQKVLKKLIGNTSKQRNIYTNTTTDMPTPYQDRDLNDSLPLLTDIISEISRLDVDDSLLTEKPSSSVQKNNTPPEQYILFINCTPDINFPLPIDRTSVTSQFNYFDASNINSLIIQEPTISVANISNDPPSNLTLFLEKKCNLDASNLLKQSNIGNISSTNKELDAPYSLLEKLAYFHKHSDQLKTYLYALDNNLHLLSNIKSDFLAGYKTNERPIHNMYLSDIISETPLVNMAQLPNNGTFLSNLKPDPDASIANKSDDCASQADNNKSPVHTENETENNILDILNTHSDNIPFKNNLKTLITKFENMPSSNLSVLTNKELDIHSTLAHAKNYPGCILLQCSLITSEAPLLHAFDTTNSHTTLQNVQKADLGTQLSINEIEETNNNIISRPGKNPYMQFLRIVDPPTPNDKKTQALRHHSIDDPNSKASVIVIKDPSTFIPHIPKTYHDNDLAIISTSYLPQDHLLKDKKSDTSVPQSIDPTMSSQKNSNRFVFLDFDESHKISAIPVELCDSYKPHITNKVMSTISQLRDTSKIFDSSIIEESLSNKQISEIATLVPINEFARLCNNVKIPLNSIKNTQLSVSNNDCSVEDPSMPVIRETIQYIQQLVDEHISKKPLQLCKEYNNRVLDINDRHATLSFDKISDTPISELVNISSSYIPIDRESDNSCLGVADTPIRSEKFCNILTAGVHNEPCGRLASDLFCDTIIPHTITNISSSYLQSSHAIDDNTRSNLQESLVSDIALKSYHDLKMSNLPLLKNEITEFFNKGTVLNSPGSKIDVTHPNALVRIVKKTSADIPHLTNGVSINNTCLPLESEFATSIPRKPNLPFKNTSFTDCSNSDILSHSTESISTVNEQLISDKRDAFYTENCSSEYKSTDVLLNIVDSPPDSSSIVQKTISLVSRLVGLPLCNEFSLKDKGAESYLRSINNKTKTPTYNDKNPKPCNLDTINLPTFNKSLLINQKLDKSNPHVYNKSVLVVNDLSSSIPLGTDLSGELISVVCSSNEAEIASVNTDRPKNVSRSKQTFNSRFINSPYTNAHVTFITISNVVNFLSNITDMPKETVFVKPIYDDCDTATTDKSHFMNIVTASPKYVDTITAERPETVYVITDRPYFEENTDTVQNTGLRPTQNVKNNVLSPAASSKISLSSATETLFSDYLGTNHPSLSPIDKTTDHYILFNSKMNPKLNCLPLLNKIDVPSETILPVKNVCDTDINSVVDSPTENTSTLSMNTTFSKSNCTNLGVSDNGKFQALDTNPNTSSSTTNSSKEIMTKSKKSNSQNHNLNETSNLSPNITKASIRINTTNITDYKTKDSLSFKNINYILSALDDVEFNTEDYLLTIDKNDNKVVPVLTSQVIQDDVNSVKESILLDDFFITNTILGSAPPVMTEDLSEEELILVKK